MEEQYRGDEPFKRFDWREGRAGVNQKNESGNIPWKCFPEQFLLTGPVEPSFWTSSGWEEDQPDADLHWRWRAPLYLRMRGILLVGRRDLSLVRFLPVHFRLLV